MAESKQIKIKNIALRRGVIAPIDLALGEPFILKEKSHYKLLVGTGNGEYGELYSVSSLAEMTDVLDAASALDNQVLAYDADLGKWRCKTLEFNADNIEFTPTSTIESTTVQNALEEIDTKLRELYASIEDTVGKDCVKWSIYPDDPNRKAIVLANHDSLTGTMTSGDGANLAMLSKWDVADFGSTKIHANLNTSDTVTINDKDVVVTDVVLDEKLETKQNVLTAGNNVTIQDDIVSAADAMIIKVW